jgi:hypothetical protein
MKRILLVLFASALAIFALPVGVPSVPSGVTVVRAATEETFTLDVAIDCSTWRFNGGIPFSAVGRGDTFIANGKIFAGYAIGSGGNDPNAPGSIGTYIEHGTMAATLAEIVAGRRPAFVATWVHLLMDGRGIVTEGPHPDSGPMAVVGGMGAFSGASGEVDVQIPSYNITGCPNVRETFALQNFDAREKKRR